MGNIIINRKFKIPIYYGDLIIYQVENSTDIIPKDYLLENSEGYSAYCKFKLVNGYNKCIIIFKEVSHEIIAHEALHITNGILLHAGVSADFNNDEPQAYLLGWVVKQIYNTVKLDEKKSNNTK